MRKKTKKDKRRILISFSICCFLAAYLGVMMIDYWSRIIHNNNVASELENKYENLLTTETELQKEIVKLGDPEYLQMYVREKYLYSKEGEIIFKFVK